MVAYVNTQIMAPCPPDDHEHAEIIGEFLEQVIWSQSGMGTSGAISWIEKLLEE